jgi:hypothetical protein
VATAQNAKGDPFPFRFRTTSSWVDASIRQESAAAGKADEPSADSASPEGYFPWFCSGNHRQSSSMADKTPSFGSAEEEVKYWREQALMFQKGMLEAREELEEFQVTIPRPLTCPSSTHPMHSRTIDPGAPESMRFRQLVAFRAALTDCQIGCAPSRLLFSSSS